MTDAAAAAAADTPAAPAAAFPARVCFRCDFESPDPGLTRCPRCRRPMLTGREVRGRGWVLAVLGTFLAAFMAVLTWVVYDVMDQTGRPGATSSFTGTRTQAFFIFLLFGAVFLFGVASLANGVHQIRSGRRNRGLMRVFLFFAAALVAAGVAVWYVLEYAG